MPKLSILVVDDDPLARKLMETHLCDHRLEFAKDAQTARQKIEAGGHDLCFIDLDLGEKDETSGLNLIPAARSSGLYSVVMSGHDSENCVERAYTLGCDDFYAKGNEGANISDIVTRYKARRRQSQNEDIFRDEFITQDPVTRDVISEALKYAACELPILILGPSGVGKTSFARIIHNHSKRFGEFVAINCSSYTEDLLEAELFGYRKGAFTGAIDNHKGKLLLADKGSLFLDEIGSMSLKMQTKLLKAIEERSFYPLGSDKPETSKFRLISATLEDIQGLIKSGKLRFDFFQRIHGLTIELKPLSQRKCDILPLISFFTRQGRRLSFSPEAKEALLQHDWPGNVRELKKLVDLLAVGQAGRVLHETLSKLIKTLTAEEGQGFVLDEHYRFALRHGLDHSVERFIDLIIERNLAENGGKKVKVLSDLKIATRILYNSLRRRTRAPLEESKK